MKMNNKISDNYSAKIAFWSRNPRVQSMPKLENLPYFGHVRFRSYEEMNRWKHDYMMKIVASGGSVWKR
jgi:hypothetical protein